MHRLGSGRLGRRSLDADAGTNCVDAFEGCRVQGVSRDRPLAALGGENDLELVLSGDRLAQAAADAQSAFDNFLQRQGGPSTSHCSKAIATEVIAVTPVRSVDSGRGSNRLL
jgi:hypothetical protein